MTASLLDTRVQDIDHCGIVPGKCEQIGFLATFGDPGWGKAEE